MILKMEVELISRGTKRKAIDSEEQGSSTYKESDEWDEEDEMPLIKLKKKRLEARTNKVEEELPLKRRLRRVTRQEKGEGCTKESSREMEIYEAFIP